MFYAIGMQTTHQPTLTEAALFALDALEHMTTEEFSRGEDRAVRIELARALGDRLTDAQRREYGL